MGRLRTVGAKFAKDTLAYRQLPRNRRRAELIAIHETLKTYQQFSKRFPEYPRQYSWDEKGHRIAVYCWPPETRPRAVVVNCPDLNGHGGLSGSVAQHLSGQGCVFLTFDLPNFGKSGGETRGAVGSVQEIIRISESFVEHSREKYPTIPLFLMGASLGGLFAFHVALKKAHVLNGCILINPVLEGNRTHNLILKKFSMMISKYFPKAQYLRTREEDGTKYSLLQFQGHDELMGSELTWASTPALQAFIKSTGALYSEFSLPYLCIQGGTDKIANPFSVFDLETDSKSVDKETVIIHDMWHSLWFDDQLEQVTTMMQDWIKQRTPQ